MEGSSNLLDEALGLEGQNPRPFPLSGRVLLVEDCVETSGAFVLHHLVKRSLSSPNVAGSVIFVALAQPFSHYERVLRKMGCNLVVQRDNNRFFFFDMLFHPEADGENCEDGLVALFGRIAKSMEDNVLSEGKNYHPVTIVIDDLSLMEVAADGSTNLVLNFLHYCHTLTSEFGCSLLLLNHKDIYSSMERPELILQVEFLADIIIKAEPLATGLAKDVHGQLSVWNKGIHGGQGSLMNRVRNFHFRIKESSVEYFYPGNWS